MSPWLQDDEQTCVAGTSASDRDGARASLQPHQCSIDDSICNPAAKAMPGMLVLQVPLDCGQPAWVTRDPVHNTPLPHVVDLQLPTALCGVSTGVCTCTCQQSQDHSH